MTDDIDNLLLEHLKRMQAELSASRERDREILSRLGKIEVALARIGRDQAGNYEEIIADRVAIDRLAERLDRLERRLELTQP